MRHIFTPNHALADQMLFLMLTALASHRSWGNLPGKIPGDPHSKESATGVKATEDSPASMPCYLDLKSCCGYSLCEVERWLALEGTYHSGLSGSH